jgi:tagatose-1,6-bisphosphate aldolase
MVIGGTIGELYFNKCVVNKVLFFVELLMYTNVRQKNEYYKLCKEKILF